MLDLRRLRLLQELHRRGTIAAVADALQFTPSAVSQQLAVLEREVGVRLLEPAGRGVRLTDPARVLVSHASALLDHAARAEAELANAANHVGGSLRIATLQSVGLRVVAPALGILAQTAPALSCELVELGPESALAALTLGDIDLVLADEWPHRPYSRPPQIMRQDLYDDAVCVVLPAHHPLTALDSIRVADLRDEIWVTDHPDNAWEQATQYICRRFGGFDPDIRHRINDTVLCLGLVEQGLAVTLLPDLVDAHRHRVAIRRIADAEIRRTIFCATRSADASRPTVQALLGTVSEIASRLGWRPFTACAGLP